MSRSLYEGASGVELDLRLELERMFSGDIGELPKEQRFLLRKMRRDDDDDLMECSCVSSLTKEPDTESQCPFCLGEGYFWDEEWVTGYSMFTDTQAHLSAKRILLQPGRVSAYDKVFFLRYSETITYDDKIIELKLDSEGNPSVPYKRKSIYRPETIAEFRSDFGRLEFQAVHVNENNAIRVK